VVQPSDEDMERQVRQVRCGARVRQVRRPGGVKCGARVRRASLDNTT
jgi:hypothetical protein